MTRVTEEQLADLDRGRQQAEQAWQHGVVGTSHMDAGVVSSGDVIDMLEPYLNAYPALAATVREQAAEIERLRATVDLVRTIVDRVDQTKSATVMVSAVCAALDGGQ